MNRRKVLITGAASGIGKATALRFAREGFDVFANDIQIDKLAALIKELPSGNHLLLDGSYAETEILQKGEKLIGENWGTLDVLVSCAGISEKTDPFNMDIDRWRQIFDLMVNGCVLISRLAAVFMKN